ncbi:enoyl-CoA hydratase/isomerase family protein [Paeniglutamicibacter sp. MACA_103]|uniref:enoyl-CoA hydratase/isomerase family protein n=1 Tax=Paeniglutamicibacter sp. MACA_103 TaxID=3377337 RepID=UPI003893265C
MSFENILVRFEGPLMWLTLNRPTEANAISIAMGQEFCAAIDQAERDPAIHVVILQGNGRFFCAGGDVAMMDAADDPAAFLKELAETMHLGLLRLARSRLITIAAVDGYAAGAGLGLVLNADVVLASERAGFLSAYGTIGLTPDCGVSYLLPQVVGPRRAAHMALLGRAVNADEGLAWGLVTEVVAQGDLVARARDLGESLGTGATQMLGPTKKLLSAGTLEGYARHLDDEAETISAMISLADTRRRIGEFLARSTR